MKKTGMPHRGEIVICRITSINPNSADAQLIEYEKTGMIHVSEVAKRWVKDIREFVKEKQYIVCKVIGVDERGISLSIKRVWREESAAKLREFKKEKKAEKVLEMIGKKMGKSLEEAWEQIGHTLEDEFGSLEKAYDIAAKNPDLFKSKGLKGPWVEKLMEIVKARYKEKTYRMRARLKLVSYQPDGVEVIKKALTMAGNLEVKYISAPNYVLICEGGNRKELEALLEQKAQAIVKAVEGKGEASYQLEK